MRNALGFSLIFSLVSFSLAGCEAESTTTNTTVVNGGSGGTAGTAGTAGSGGSKAGSGGSSAGTAGSSAGSGGNSAGNGGTAGSGGNNAGSGGNNAGAGGAAAGAGGDAGAGGAAAGAGGDAGAGGEAAGAGGDAAGAGGDAGAGGEAAGAGGAAAGAGGDAGAGGEAAGAGGDAAGAGGDAGAGGEAAGAGGDSAGAGGDAGAGGEAAGAGGDAAGAGGASAGAGGAAAGAGGAAAGSGGAAAGSGGAAAGSGGAAAGAGGSAPLTCADIYSDSDCGVCGEKNCCAEAEACEKDADCSECLRGDDTKCKGAALDKLNSCLDTKCQSTCTGSCNDGGTEYKGANACDTCQQTEFGGCCATEGAACANSQDCADLTTCANACADAICVQDCMAKFPNGADAFRGVVGCLFGDGGATTNGACGLACTPSANSCSDGGTNYGAANQTNCSTCTETEQTVGGCCSSESQLCATNQSCIDLVDCVNQCADQACADACGAKIPGGVDNYNTLVGCLFGPDANSVGACGTVCAP